MIRTQILVSKYHSPLRGSLEKLLVPGQGKESTRFAKGVKTNEDMPKEHRILFEAAPTRQIGDKHRIKNDNDVVIVTHWNKDKGYSEPIEVFSKEGEGGKEGALPYRRMPTN